MDIALQEKIQSEYNALDFPPGASAAEILKKLAEKHNLTLDELLNTIEL